MNYDATAITRGPRRTSSPSRIFADDPTDCAAFTAGPARSPERKLLAAVLEEAIADWCRAPRVKLDGDLQRRVDLDRDELRDWFTSDASDHPFAFAAICEALGFDVDATRRAIFARRGA